jgi:hypothetical protein
MKTLILSLQSISFAIVTLLASCRSVGALTGNEFASPQAKLEWVARPELDQPKSDSPTVFVRPFKDAVGAGLDLTPQIRQAVEAAGYKITDSRDADYQLVATLRHFDKAKSFDGGEGAMHAVETVAPLVGAAAGAYAGSDQGSAGMVAGGILGGVSGSLASAAMENLSKVYEWDLILDLELSERIDGGFTEERSHTEAAGSGSNVTVGTESGGRTTSDERKASITKEQSHLRNTFRLVGVAYQMTMTREEALNELLPRLPQSISSSLP